jgi:hypothetical protein
VANSPPLWAQALVERVCADAGRKARPIVRWHPGSEAPADMEAPEGTEYRLNGERFDANAAFSCGYTQGGLIRVFHGWLRKDQRLTVLHELAHWLTGEGHTRKFWDCAWALYLRYMPRSLPFVLERGLPYKKGAVAGAHRAGLTAS